MFTTASAAKSTIAKSTPSISSKTVPSTAVKIKSTNGDAVNRLKKGSPGTKASNILVQMLRSGRLQTRLTMGTPQDRSKGEGDQMADQVMARPATVMPELTGIKNNKKVQPQEEEELQAQEKEKNEGEGEFQAQEEEGEFQTQEEEEKLQPQEEEAVQAPKGENRKTSATTSTARLKTDLNAAKYDDEPLSESPAPAPPGVSDPATDTAPKSAKESLATPAPIPQPTPPISPGPPEKTSRTASAAFPATAAPPGKNDGEKTTVAPPSSDALSLVGKSDEIMATMAGSSPSQVAASYPSMGTAIKDSLDKEQKETAGQVAPLEARTDGVTNIPGVKIQEVTPGKNAKISKGDTEGEPLAPKIGPHKNSTQPTGNKDKTQLLDKKAAGEGFLSWLKTNLSGFMSKISTRDPALRTDAGERPQIDTRGQANPNRAENQRNDGQTQVDGLGEMTTEQLNTHPGKQKIQPVKVDEKAPIPIAKQTGVSLETKGSDDMARFAAMAIPANVRGAADVKMAPQLQKSLSKPKADVSSAAKKRDEDKDQAIKKGQAEADQQSTEARREQDEIVEASRKTVSHEQEKGIKEAREQINSFNKEADTEQTTLKKGVDNRIKTDEDQASKQLSDAEKEAEEKKRKGEAEAQKKKKEMEKESKNDSWWDRAKSAIKSAVTAITDAIDAVFTAVRNAVKFLIEKAKAAALAVIEAGRKWIVAQLDKFGKWLKDKVNKYLSAFPALQKRINAAIDNTVNKAKNAVNAVAKKLKAGVNALANALGKFVDAILSKFQAAMKAAVQIAGALLTGDFAAAARIAFMAVMEIAGINPKPIMDFLNRAGDTLSTIFKDPVAFFMNVVNGVKKGIQQFQKNIKKHLIAGLIGWLTGALSEVEITLPDKFDLKGIFSLVMQILGLTWQNIRGKIVKKLGPRGETIVSTIEKSVTFVKDLITKGPIALWERVKSSLANIKETVIGGIRDWVVVTVIKEGIVWLLSLLNPAAAIVKAVKLLYDLVMFFVERWGQIVDFAKSVFDSVGALARGAIGKAANTVESALGKSVPVIISLLASLIGLGGIGKAVKKIILKIRAPIDKALDKTIGWLVKKGKALFAKGKATVKKGVEKGKATVKKFFEWWKFKEKFTSKDGKSHSFAIQGGEENPKIMVASTPREYKQFLDDAQKKLDETKSQKGQRDETVVKLINKARKQYTEIRTELDRQKRAKGKAGADKAAIDALTAKLRDLASTTKVLIRDLMLEDGSTDIPVSDDPGFGGSNGGFGKGMTINRLTLKGKAGSPPNPSVMGDNWKSLNLRRTGDKNSSYYVLGHLLNEQVHGPGNKPENLTPLTRKGNKKHEQDVEADVKKAVFKGGVIRYEVTPNYKSWKSEGLKSKLSQEPDEKTRNDKAKIIEAEKFVPDSLTCTAYNVHPVTGKKLKDADLKAVSKEKQVVGINNKTVNNTIDAGALSQYQLTDSEKVTYELKSIDLNSPYPEKIKNEARRKEVAVKGLLQLGGVGKNVAENIYKNRTALTSWSDVVKIKQVGKATVEKLQNQNVAVTVNSGQTVWDPPLPGE
ncbi:hypothetical protein HRM2_13060 [Desulforapulum autotrophicum HRM2]|uniref:Uncharacterized protein n=1 Tax=Desulforapulum autotrophicum (strain ATCC 43914 / DSM 3382 / VKM B-1955 / HRM2) TaxID=177437 RepID=C0Q8S7_DESAH|nr:hypothetical protein [Desulforapulum autotrophicum]ACN14417.1 hypothetical protein HRM2_13060 [Desulforapulum autotrophicum HRM2]